VRIMFVFAAICAASVATAQQPAQPIALTIYNQSFAVARTSVDLDLHSGPNEVTTTNVTSMLEPDSVVLRDPSGKRIVRIVEQNYDAGVVDQSWLLSKYEGKTINFQISPGQIVQGKIIRAGFQPPYAYPYNNPYPNGAPSQPLVEVNGQMQFSLPGMPLFPAATDGLLLKPTLRWQIQSENDARFVAELAYITGGLDWEATYNIVAPDNPDVTTTEKADFLGWVTIHNESGSDFPSARIKLMAGDVAKIRQQAGYGGGTYRFADALAVNAAAAPQVTQKAFDDFHLYDLNRTVSLANGEIKQVQFIEVSGIELRRSYIYDGASMQIQPIYPGNINEQRGYGLDPENHKVLVVQEIKNSEANHLGMPLPAGRIRLYRRDTDGQIEFTGESTIPHTPAEETLRIPTGGAFDVRGTRRQTDFHVNQSERTLDENFEIKLTNQKPQPVTVNVVEHLYRCDNWDITQKSSDYSKRDSHTIEFPIQIPAKGDATLTYAVHYTW
jgi:hypothetical protein